MSLALFLDVYLPVGAAWVPGCPLLLGRVRPDEAVGHTASSVTTPFSVLTLIILRVRGGVGGHTARSRAQNQFFSTYF